MSLEFRNAADLHLLLSRWTHDGSLFRSNEQRGSRQARRDVLEARQNLRVLEPRDRTTSFSCKRINLGKKIIPGLHSSDQQMKKHSLSSRGCRMTLMTTIAHKLNPILPLEWILISLYSKGFGER